MMKRAHKIRLAILGGFAVAVLLLWIAVFEAEAGRGLLRMAVFDIGQGDGIFFETPAGTQVLFDSGPDQRILAKLGQVMPFWDHSIDVLVLSHPHADHVTGAIDVLKRYTVGMIVESGADYSTAEFAELRRLIAEKNIPIHIAEAGETFNFGDGVRFDILLPTRTFVGQSPKNIHDSMVVGKLIFASSSVLLMGDAEASLEYQLLASGGDIHADILKVGHHGSKTSTGDIFLRAVNPKIAVISVGRKNRYGHPYADVLARLKAFGISVFRTDIDGDVRFSSDGHGWIKEWIKE